MRLAHDVDWWTERFIAVHDGALADDWCSRIVAQFDKSDKVSPGRTGSGVDTSRKRSWDLTLDGHREWSGARHAILSATRPLLIRYLEHYHFSLIGGLAQSIQNAQTGIVTSLNADNWQSVGRPIAGALTFRLYRTGPFSVQKYERGIGGYPHWHSEIFPQLGTSDALHRVLFVIIYLNDVDEGGETEFYYQDLSVSPRKGRIVIAPAGFTHTHRGLVPISGDKYVLTSWLLFRPAQELFGGN